MQMNRSYINHRNFDGMYCYWLKKTLNIADELPGAFSTILLVLLIRQLKTQVRVVQVWVTYYYLIMQANCKLYENLTAVEILA